MTRHGKRMVSGARGVLLAGALAAVAPGGAALAAERLAPSRGQDDGFAALVLDHSPAIFDLSVRFARSFVAVTYGSRAYDPVTRSFVVRDLRFERGGVVVEIGRLRTDATTGSLDDVVLDTRALPLDPETRGVLRSLDAEILRASVALGAVTDEPSASVDFDVSVDIENVGRLEASVGLDGVHVLVPLDEPPGDGGSGRPPEVLGALRFATLSLEDRGLVDAAIDVMAREQGLTPEAARAMAAGIARTMPLGFVAGLPGGDDPALTRRAEGWGEALAAFVAEPDRIFVGIDPAAPFALSSLTADQLSGEAIEALNPAVVAGPPPQAVTLLDAASLAPAPDAPAEARLAAAASLIAGRGTPQDPGRGLALVLPEALAGDAGAVRLAAQALAADPALPLDGAEAGRLYAAMLLAGVAVAGNGEVPDPAGIAALRARLDPAALAAAETRAGEAFAATPEGAQRRAALDAALAGRDFPALRRAAFDAYDGRGVPRDLAMAHALASIAAAGGDVMAAALRDDIARGGRERLLALDPALARTMAADLWAGVLAGGAARDGSGTGASPDRRPADDPEAERN